MERVCVATVTRSAAAASLALRRLVAGEEAPRAVAESAAAAAEAAAPAVDEEGAPPLAILVREEDAEAEAPLFATAAAVVADLDPARNGRAMNLSASALFFSAMDLCASGSSSEPQDNLASARPGSPPWRLRTEIKPPGSSLATCVTSVSAQALAGSYSGSSGAKV
jgi:hypothetical protein